MSSYYKNCNVLVTGGAGFIGSHLTEKLVELGAHVTVLDDFSTGSLANLNSVVNAINLIGGTITDYETCVRATKNVKIIFHCAAQTSVPGSMENPRICYQTNIQGTSTILEAARHNNVERFIFSSSSAVYGEREGRCSEDVPCNPTSPYGYSKLMGELLCKQYWQFFNLQTVCLRYFNVYGPRQDPHGTYAAALAKFRYQMYQNKPITMFGDGQQTRDFVSVNEVVQANVQLGILPAQKVAGEVFNIATGTSVSLLELIKTLKEKEFPGFDQDIIFAPARRGDIRHIEADCSRYHNLLSDINSI
jgi:nucleoside-diphosphate-sugar epimerase